MIDQNRLRVGDKCSVKRKITSPSTIRFKQWQRKNYALFQVLGKQIAIGVLSLVYFLVTKPVDAQVNNQSDSARFDYAIEEVEVRGQRIGIAMNQIPRLVSVISKQEIERSAAQSISDFLNESLSLDVRQRGRGGIQNDISLGGGSFEQVLILINGVPFNDPQTGHFNADIPIPLLAVERIEILDGPASRWLGPNAFSGAINIITNTQKGNRIDLDLVGGQHQYAQSEISVHHNKSGFSQMLSGGYSRTEGYTENTDYQKWSSYYALNYKKKAFRTFAQAGASGKKFGANSFYTPSFPDQYEEILSGFFSAGWEYQKKFHFKQEYYQKAHLDAFHLFRYEAPEWYSGANHHLSQVQGLANTIWWEGLVGRFTLGADWRRERVNSTVLGEPAADLVRIPWFETTGYLDKQAVRSHYSLSGSHLLVRDKLSLSSGVMGHFSSGKNQGFRLYPGFDLRYRLSKRLNMYAGLNRSLRLPSFTELYYSSPSNQGNVDLEPEQAWTFQAGAQLYQASHRFHVNGFIAKSNNSIDWTKGPLDDKWISRNSQSLTRTGLEVRHEWSPNQLSMRWQQLRFSWGYRYTVLSQFESEMDSKYVLDYLKHKVMMKLTLPLSRKVNLDLIGLWQDRAGFYTDWNQMGDSFLNAYDPFLLTDIRLTYTRKQAVYYINIDNAFNADYEDIGHVRQPGRWIRLGMRLNFSYL